MLSRLTSLLLGTSSVRGLEPDDDPLVDEDEAILRSWMRDNLEDDESLVERRRREQQAWDRDPHG